MFYDRDVTLIMLWAPIASQKEAHTDHCVFADFVAGYQNISPLSGRIFTFVINSALQRDARSVLIFHPREPPAHGSSIRGQCLAATHAALPSGAFLVLSFSCVCGQGQLPLLLSPPVLTPSRVPGLSQSCLLIILSSLA